MPLLVAVLIQTSALTFSYRAHTSIEEIIDEATTSAANLSRMGWPDLFHVRVIGSRSASSADEEICASKVHPLSYVPTHCKSAGGQLKQALKSSKVHCCQCETSDPTCNVPICGKSAKSAYNKYTTEFPMITRMFSPVVADSSYSKTFFSKTGGETASIRQQRNMNAVVDLYVKAQLALRNKAVMKAIEDASKAEREKRVDTLASIVAQKFFPKDGSNKDKPEFYDPENAIEIESWAKTIVQGLAQSSWASNIDCRVGSTH